MKLKNKMATGIPSISLPVNEDVVSFGINEGAEVVKEQNSDITCRMLV